MALDANRLGIAWYQIDQDYNETDIDPATIEAVRQQIEIRKAHALINELVNNGEVPALGLFAPNGTVTGTAKIT